MLHYTPTDHSRSPSCPPACSVLLASLLPAGENPLALYTLSRRDSERGNLLNCAACEHAPESAPQLLLAPPLIHSACQLQRIAVAGRDLCDTQNHPGGSEPQSGPAGESLPGQSGGQ